MRIVLRRLITRRLHRAWKGPKEGGGCSTIFYRRSAHGGEWGERICSDGVLRFGSSGLTIMTALDTHNSSKYAHDSLLRVWVSCAPSDWPISMLLQHKVISLSPRSYPPHDSCVP